MKKISLYIAFLFLSLGVFAQVDRSQYPQPGPAPEINIGTAESFTLPNGLKVFVVENHKLPRVSYSLVFDRDPIWEGDKAGLTELFGNMMMGGTDQYSKDALNEAIDQIGAQIGFSSGGASATSLTKYQETLLELFSEVLLNPTFPAEELEKSVKMKLSALANAKDDPSSISEVVSHAVVFGKDHPYGESADEETVKNLTTQDFKDFYRSYYKPNGAYLAIVGDITKKQAEQLVKKYFSSWERGDVPTHEWKATAAPASNQVILVDRPSSVQSVINVTYPVDFQYNSPDRIPASLLSYILGGGSSSRLFLNLREDKGYTYGAYSSLRPDKITGQFSANASVRTEVTGSAIHEFFVELEKMNQRNISDQELELAKAAISGSFGRSLENPATIASFALNTEIYDLPKDYYKNYLKNVDAVTVDQLNQLAPKYIKPDQAYVVVVGNVDAFKDQVGTYGSVKYYTVEGDPAPAPKAVSTDITADQVIARYIEAIGGKANLEKVNTMKQSGGGEVQGMKISQNFVVDKKKGIAVQRTFMGTQEISKATITRDKVTISAMGQEQALPEEAAKGMQSILWIFPELYYAEKGIQVTLDGIKSIEGQDAYKVMVDNQGNKTTEYFSVESGLKLKSENAVQGEVLYGDYKTFDGVKIPAKLSVKNPQMPVIIEMVLSTVEMNPTLTDADFQ